MNPDLRPGRPLAAAAPGNELHRRWLNGPATRELDAVRGPPRTAAPFFAAAETNAWAESHRRDLPERDRERFDRDLAALARGEAAVVITGQQPGFLGGPLLVLYKIATAVALARRLEERGQPAVPVFWSGDDDDDLIEALAPYAWRSDGTLARSENLEAARHGRLARRRTGTLAAADWLDQHAPAEEIVGDSLGLVPVWRQLATDWATLTRRSLLRAFAGCGLMVVSGDDPRLHAAAAGFYGEVAGRRRELAGLVRERGRDLAANGGHAQLAERSLSRSLYRVEDSRRRPLAALRDAPAADVRPGVLLRSPLQDHLFRPAAVVVGPGEQAYLQQLEPVYGALGLARCPLVPRLAGWLLPDDFDGALLARHEDAAARAARLERELSAWLAETGASLGAVLQASAGLPAARARLLADGRTRRWSRGLHSLVRGERSRLLAAGPREPQWVFPGGGRQERRLAWGPVLVRGGHRLRETILAAAAAHLDAGRDGNWQQWEMRIHESQDD